MASVDDPATNKEFAESLGADFPLLSDPGKEVAMAYGVLMAGGQFANRWTYIIGADGTILRVDKDVNPSRAGQDLVADLTELGVAMK